MYSRRRPQREKIFFSFDSFLDVVANVIGVIIRLILVTWVGARSYSETMKFMAEEPPAGATAVALTPLPAPLPEDDPASKELEQTRREIDQARARLLEQLRQLETVQTNESQVSRELDKLKLTQQQLDREKQAIANMLAKRGQQVHYAALSAEELRNHGKKLLEEIKTVEKLPTATKTLRYQTPVSRPIRDDEIFFECRQGRVTYIDIAAFHHEMRAGLEDKGEELKSRWDITAATTAIGAFRMRYTIERGRDFAGDLAPDSPPRKNASFHYGLSRWVLEPLTENRGETLETALAEKSYFRQIVDGLDAQQSVVTLWVYPDSFELFRRLRDFLHERDIEVAGRPLPVGAPISASRHGTASRGQ